MSLRVRSAVFSLSPCLRRSATTMLGAACVGILLILQGCSVALQDQEHASATPLVMGSLSGHYIGGSNPIAGATVVAYTTTSNGYGVATKQQEANSVTNLTGSGDTDNTGKFTFAGGFACPSGQFLYLTGSGGNTGSSATAVTATATAALTSGGVSSISVSNMGSGYVATGTTVTITSTDGNGSGAVATATVVNGMVKSIAVNAAGTGYDAPPTVTISAPNNPNNINNNAVLVVALGRCDDLYNSSTGAYTIGSIVMNEVSTVAAAYALGNFATETGSGSSTVVGIGAPATNNAAFYSGVSTGCVAGDPIEGNSGTSCPTTAAAGLAHAFQNAANLVNYAPATPTTGANFNLPGNSSAIVPRALINTLGNILVSCVNSAGGVANDGSSCGTLFQATKIGTSVPVDTFGAMKNLAANPTLGGSGSAAKNLYSLSATNPPYAGISSTNGLNDYSLAIVYPAGVGAATGAQGLAYPYTGALDMNDVYYVGNWSASSSTRTNVVAIGNAGVANASANYGYIYSYGLSVDALGNGYYGDGNNSASTALVYFTAVNGVPAIGGAMSLSAAYTAQVFNTAVDRSNNVWTYGYASSTQNSVYESPALSNGILTFTLQATVTGTIPSAKFVGLAIDPCQNVWTANNQSLAILPAGAYTGSPVSGSTTGSPADGISFYSPSSQGTGSCTPATPYTAYVSSYNTTPDIQPFTPTLASNGAVTAATGQTATTGSKISGTAFNAADGNGTIWLADLNSQSVVAFLSQAASATAYRVMPCYIATSSSTTCTALFSAKPYDISVDSTGSVWTVSPAGGLVSEIIGSAAPTWPLLSLGMVGKP